MSFFDRVDSFFNSLGKAAGAAVTPGASVLAEPTFSRKRLDICMACPDRTGVTCGVCHCFVRAKTKLVTEKCPQGKW